MENSSVKENVKLLMKELSLLMRIRPGGGEAENHRWSKIVQSSELEVHSTCKKFHELRNGSNTEMEIAKVELNTEAIHLMKHVKCLQECGNVQLLKRDQESDKPKMYSYKELGSFTGDFSTEIGSGGYANVYKGELPAGTDIAVKVLKEQDDLDTFFSELSTLGRNSHRYLVKLYGYCFEKEKKALVYEYMENGSFGNILYGNPRGLDWKKFYEIAISIAEGLSYLHHDCLETIIHYDIKPANVLIDSNLSPKIADFGSAKFMNQCLTHRTNTGLKGTENFVAPEVAYPGFEVNEKSDVYSFGMLLFEILGMKRLDRSKGWFPRGVYMKLKAGELDQILKASRISQENSDDARILSVVALWCIQFKPTARPSMNKVVKMLRKQITLRSPPDPLSQFAESSMPRIQEEAYSKSPPSTYDESSFRLHGRQIEEHIAIKYANNLLESVNMFESSSSETLLQELAAEKLKRYSFEDLLSFTHNFSSIIGIGAYSKVYKGQFPNGVKVAVKILQEDVDQEMFAREVSTMGRTSHRYLVKLYGYCVHEKMKAVVYEYVENGSFDKILYGNPLGLDWKKFYEIAIAIAKGLSYLHDDCLETIIHHDVKTANVLIDSKFSVKITAFGLAKLMKKDVSNLTSTGMRGIPGYTAPEAWFPFAPISPKIDVYGFGMLLFEILGMEKNYQSNTDRWFPEHVWEKFYSGTLDKLLQECGIGPKNRTKAEILSKVALWCTQYTPSARPKMRTVVQYLETETCAWIPQNPEYYLHTLKEEEAPIGLFEEEEEEDAWSLFEEEEEEEDEEEEDEAPIGLFEEAEEDEAPIGLFEEEEEDDLFEEEEEDEEEEDDLFEEEEDEEEEDDLFEEEEDEEEEDDLFEEEEDEAPIDLFEEEEEDEQ